MEGSPSSSATSHTGHHPRPSFAKAFSVYLQTQQRSPGPPGVGSQGSPGGEGIAPLQIKGAERQPEESEAARGADTLAETGPSCWDGKDGTDTGGSATNPVASLRAPRRSLVGTLPKADSAEPATGATTRELLRSLKQVHHAPYCVIARVLAPGSGTVLLSWCFDWDAAPKDILGLPGAFRGFEVVQGRREADGAEDRGRDSLEESDDKAVTRWSCARPPLSLARSVGYRYVFVVRAVIGVDAAAEGAEAGRANADSPLRGALWSSQASVDVSVDLRGASGIPPASGNSSTDVAVEDSVASSSTSPAFTPPQRPHLPLGPSLSVERSTDKLRPGHTSPVWPPLPVDEPGIFRVGRGEEDHTLLRTPQRGQRGMDPTPTTPWSPIADDALLRLSDALRTFELSAASAVKGKEFDSVQTDGAPDEATRYWLQAAGQVSEAEVGKRTVRRVSSRPVVMGRPFCQAASQETSPLSGRSPGTEGEAPSPPPGQSVYCLPPRAARGQCFARPLKVPPGIRAACPHV